jgi:hypothetical protein
MLNKIQRHAQGQRRHDEAEPGRLPRKEAPKKDGSRRHMHRHQRPKQQGAQKKHSDMELPNGGRSAT